MKFSHTEWKLSTRHENNLGISFHAHEMIQFLFLAKPCNGFFPPSRPLLVQNKTKKEGRKKKKCEFVRQQYIRFRKIFLIFSCSCCKIFVMVVMKVLLHCRVADKWHSVCEKKYACVILYFQQFYARSHNFT